MKKLFLLISLSLFICTCSACNQEKEENSLSPRVDKYEGKSGDITCIIEKDTQELDFKGTYSITYEEGYVTKVYTREVMNINSVEALNSYADRIKQEYKKYDELEHYEYSISTSSNKVINNTFIDYKQLDLEKFSSISEEKIVKEDLKVSKILASYKILGAKCEE